MISLFWYVIKELLSVKVGGPEINLVWQVSYLVALFLNILLPLPWLSIQYWAKIQKQLTTAFFLVLFQTDLQKEASCLTVMHEETRFAGSCLPLNFPWLWYRLLPLLLSQRVMAAGLAWESAFEFSSQSQALGNDTLCRGLPSTHRQRGWKSSKWHYIEMLFLLPLFP